MLDVAGLPTLDVRRVQPAEWVRVHARAGFEEHAASDAVNLNHPYLARPEEIADADRYADDLE